MGASGRGRFRAEFEGRGRGGGGGLAAARAIGHAQQCHAYGGQILTRTDLTPDCFRTKDLDRSGVLHFFGLKISPPEASKVLSGP